MRTRKEIEDVKVGIREKMSIHNSLPALTVFQGEIIIELLLDIRDLLTTLKEEK